MWKVKVAVFAKPAGGKLTLSKPIAMSANLPLHSLDLVQYEVGGVKVPEDAYVEPHLEILREECWQIEGFGPVATLRQRISEADTLIYMDRPMWKHYWWATKRPLFSPFKEPEGWTARSPLFRSTTSSLHTVNRGRTFWTSFVA